MKARPARNRRADVSSPSAPPDLLLFGWYCEGTGFTRVLRALVRLFEQHYRITWVGVGYKGEPQQISDRVRVLPTNQRGGDLMGAYAARLRWRALRPDAVLTLNDMWYLKHYSREFASLGPVPLVGYLPLDGAIPTASLVEGLNGFHSLYTYTSHAADQLRSALRACGKATPVAVAGHGVDLETFSPLADVRDAGFDSRARMRLAQHVFALQEPSWVVLNASRPDPRKRIDLTIEGFARFARDLPSSVRLCLHHAIAHPQYVEPLRQQAIAIGIADRILWWPRRAAPLDDAGLAALYNASAVGLNTSLGEGFGLVSFEHGATGAPQVIPDHAALRELWGDAALRLGPVRPLMTRHSPLLMGEVAPAHVASALQRLYRDEDVYRRFALAAYERSQAPDLRWSAAADSLLRGLREATAAKQRAH